MLLPDMTTTTTRPAILAEGGQPRPLGGIALCAALRRAGRMLGDPTTQPGAVADMLESGAVTPRSRRGCPAP